MKKLILFAILLFVIFINPVYAVTNPYGKYQDLYGITTVRCTWYAWEQAYEHTGVALPGWGNAQSWYNSAINAGYKVGSEARANSIAVWSSSDGYGHVGFVVSVEGDLMTVNEAGIVTDENEGIVNGSRKYTTAGNLIGFIYLDEVPTKNNSSNNNTTNNKVDTTNNETKANNANLQELRVNVDGFTFIKDVTSYKLEVAYETQIINIEARAEDENALVTGTGDKALKVGDNVYIITVTAEDNTTKEYKITITREEEKVNYSGLEENQADNYWDIYMGLIIIFIILIIVILVIRKKRGKKE